MESTTRDSVVASPALATEGEGRGATPDVPVPHQQSRTGLFSANRFGLSWPLIVAAGVFLALLDCSSLLNDPDTYWHIGAGRWILEHGAIPVTDPFSHTMLGARWIAHEWLSEVLFASAFNYGGWPAVLLLPALAFAATLGISTRFLLRHLQPAHALMCVAIAWSLTAGHLLARPHVLALPIMTYWCVALLKAREEERAPPYRLMLAMIAWANLHASFAVGIGLVVAFAAEALIAASDRPTRRYVVQTWGAFLLATLASSLVTPHGLHGWAFVAQVGQMEFALATIEEWRSPDFQKLQPLEVVLLLSAAAVMSRGLTLPIVRLALVLGLLHLALKHARHTELIGLLAPLVVAQPWGRQWRSPDDKSRLASVDRWFAALSSPARPTAVAITMATLAIAGGLQLRFSNSAPEGAISPAAAIQAARAANASGSVLNAYTFGGYLIFNGIAPFIDGRADLYGDEFLERFVGGLNLSEPGQLAQLLEDHKIGWTLLPPSTPAVSLLDRLPGWRRVYSDDIAVVHIRTDHAGRRLALAEQTNDRR